MVVWQKFTVDSKYQQFSQRVMSHADFLKFDITTELLDQLERRIKV